MSIRSSGLLFVVLCDACGLGTSPRTSPLAAFNGAISIGWTTGTPQHGHGIRCPNCAGTPINRDLPHLADSPRRMTTHPTQETHP